MASRIGCPYCDILAGRAIGRPTALEEEDFVSFMGRFQPTGPGYSLVIPRKHVQDLHSLPTNQLAPMLDAVRRVSVAIVQAFGASGTTVMQNNGAPGQKVGHLHFHVVPRHLGDAYPCESEIEVPVEELNLQAERLRDALR